MVACKRFQFQPDMSAEAMRLIDDKYMQMKQRQDKTQVQRIGITVAVEENNGGVVQEW